MNYDDSKIPSELFNCFAASGAALTHQKYRDALSILEQGLNQSYDPAEIDSLYLLECLRTLVGYLAYHLKKAYGKNWEEEVGIPEIPEKEIRCSFCGKSPDEAGKIIAGAEGNICDECIGVCNEVLATEFGSG